MKVRPLDLGEVVLVPVIRGLVSEGGRVRALVRNVPADAVALSVAPEELEVLGSAAAGPWSPTSVQDRIYAEALEAFGPVAMPPPCFVAAAQAAREQGLDAVPLDLDEEAFTDLYLREVGTLDLLRHNRRLRQIERNGLEAATPEALVQTLDRRLAHPASFRRVEAAREDHMARTLVDRVREGRLLLALVEVERFPGVARRYKAALSAPEGPLESDPVSKDESG